MNDHDSNLPKYKSFRATKEESRDQEIDHTTQDEESTKPLCNNPNLAADFWRRDIGINVIPADTRKKCTNIQWKQYQDSPISDWQHQKWKLEGAFSKGMAIIPGIVWHRKDKKGLFFVSIDGDKKIGIRELCTRNGKTISLQKMAKKFVEQHKDDLDRGHISFYSPMPFPQKTPDTVLGLEIKGLGEHGIVFCSPSIYKNGAPYEIIGTTEPVVLNLTEASELIQHINNICTRYGVPYLEKDSNLDKLRPTICS